MNECCLFGIKKKKKNTYHGFGREVGLELGTIIAMRPSHVAPNAPIDNSGYLKMFISNHQACLKYRVITCRKEYEIRC